MESLQLKQKKIITLIGRIINPVVFSQSTYWKHGCLVKVVGDPKKETKPLFTTVGKLVYGKNQYPTVLQGFRGFVKVSCVGFSEEQLKRKIEPFLRKSFLGSKTAEGYGRVIWESCELKDYPRTRPTVFVNLSEICPQCKNRTVIYDKNSKLKRVLLVAKHGSIRNSKFELVYELIILKNYKDCLLLSCFMISFILRATQVKFTDK